MAVVSKRQEVKDKKYSHLKKIYTSTPLENSSVEENIEENSFPKIKEVKLSRKELLFDFGIMLSIVAVAFVGYVVSRFV